MKGEASVLCFDISSVPLYESLCERKGLGGGVHVHVNLNLDKLQMLKKNSGIILIWKIISTQHVLKIEI